MDLKTKEKLENKQKTLEQTLAINYMFNSIVSRFGLFVFIVFAYIAISTTQIPVMLLSIMIAILGIMITRWASKNYLGLIHAKMQGLRNYIDVVWYKEKDKKEVTLDEILDEEHLPDIDE